MFVHSCKICKAVWSFRDEFLHYSMVCFKLSSPIHVNPCMRPSPVTSKSQCCTSNYYQKHFRNCNIFIDENCLRFQSKLVQITGSSNWIGTGKSYKGQNIPHTNISMSSYIVLNYRRWYFLLFFFFFLTTNAVYYHRWLRYLWSPNEYTINGIILNAKRNAYKINVNMFRRWRAAFLFCQFHFLYLWYSDILSA